MDKEKNNSKESGSLKNPGNEVKEKGVFRPSLQNVGALIKQAVPNQHIMDDRTEKNRGTLAWVRLRKLRDSSQKVQSMALCPKDRDRGMNFQRTLKDLSFGQLLLGLLTRF